MNNFLVTGGAGFIGSNICKELVKQDCSVRVVDNLLTGKKSNLEGIIDKIEFIQADIGDPDVARDAVKDVDCILHQAALPSVPRSLEDPLATHQHCLNATFTLLLAARDAKIKRFVYAASSSAYGDTPTLPKVESMPVNPLSPYAASKLAGEQYCSVFANVFDMQTVSLRYFNVFGPHQDPASQYAAAVPAFATSILKDERPTVFGNGRQSRDFTYIDNVVHANLLAARTPETAGQSLNIACGQAVTVNEMIEVINHVLGKNIKPIYADRRPGDVMHSLADISLAKAVIGYKPKVDFKKGLERAINWYKDNLI